MKRKLIMIGLLVGIPVLMGSMGAVPTLFFYSAVTRMRAALATAAPMTPVHHEMSEKEKEDIEADFRDMSRVVDVDEAKHEAFVNDITWTGSDNQERGRILGVVSGHLKIKTGNGTVTLRSTSDNRVVATRDDEGNISIH